jgi:predicted DCC family thiol-disulfide oxidoreductase YuxK
MRARIKRLTVFYDDRCEFCIRAAGWLAFQDQYIPIETVPRRAGAAVRRLGERMKAEDQLLVLDDRGGLYRGPQAFIICLYALKDHREWAMRLAEPAMMPLARIVFQTLSENRKLLARGPIPAWLLGNRKP